MDFMKKPILVGIAIAFLVITLIGTGAYLSRKGPEELAQATSVHVEVVKVRRGSLTREMTVVGTLESNNSVVLKAQVRGLISKVRVIGGESVQKGELLFEIDDRTYNAVLKDAQASLVLAASNFEREQKLSDKNFGTVKKLEEARAQLLKAQAATEKAQKEVDDTKIRAPFEGVVGLHRLSEGTPVASDAELISITDTDPMKVNFKMPAKFIPYLSLDQRVNIQVDSYPDQKFQGRVEAIDAQVDAGAQSIAVQATIPNEKNLLKPGMFVRVKVVIGSKDNSLIIPEEAVVVESDQSYVWRVIEHPEKPGMYVAYRVQILTGIQEKNRLEVTRNLAEDNIIIVVGYQKVGNGVPVNFDLASVDLAPVEEEKPEEKKVDEKKEEAVKPEAKEEAKAEAKKKADVAPEADVPSFLSRVKAFFSGDKKEEAPIAEAKIEDAKNPNVAAAPKQEAPKSEPVTPAAPVEPAPAEKAPEAQPAPAELESKPAEAEPKGKAKDKAIAPVAMKAKKPMVYNKTNTNLKALFASNRQAATKK